MSAPDEPVSACLLALNAERAAEERAAGLAPLTVIDADAETEGAP